MNKPREGDLPVIKRFALLAHSGKGNLGDEATMAAAIRNISLRQPGAEIEAFTLNPEDTRERHQVRAHPIRRPRAPIPPPTENREPSPAVSADRIKGRLKESSVIHSVLRGPAASADRIKQGLKQFPLIHTVLRGLRDGVLAVPACFSDLAFLFQSSRRLKGADLLVVVGGGQLGDYFGGAWGFPYTILRWSLLARLRGAQVAFLSVGAGPIGSPLSRTFFRWALSMARYRSFRDEGSRRLIESLGVPTENHVFPDLVHGLPVEESNGRSRGAARVIGINPLPFHDSRYWAEDDPDVYRRYVEKLASFAAWLIEAGHRVILFPTQVVADVPVVHDVEELVQSRLRSLAPEYLDCPPVQSLDDLIAVTAKTDLVVASRFHGIVISLLMNKPVIGLSYDRKTNELMTDVGMGDYVSDIDGFETNWLVSRFERLWGEADAAVDRVRSRRAAYQAALDDQYDLLFGLPSREGDATNPCLASERTCGSPAEAGV